MSVLVWMILALAVIAIVLILVIRVKNRKISEKQSEVDELARRLEQQKGVTQTYAEAHKEGAEIQRKAAEKEDELHASVKEAKTSDKPVEAHIKVGNGIVDSFNNPSV